MGVPAREPWLAAVQRVRGGAILASPNVVGRVEGLSVASGKHLPWQMWGRCALPETLAMANVLDRRNGTALRPCPRRPASTTPVMARVAPFSFFGWPRTRTPRARAAPLP